MIFLVNNPYIYNSPNDSEDSIILKVKINIAL